MKKITKLEFDNFHTEVKQKYITDIELDNEEYQWIVDANEIFQSTSDLNNQHNLSKQEIDLAKKSSEVIIHFQIPYNMNFLVTNIAMETLYDFMDDDVSYCMFVSYDSSLSQENIISNMFFCFKK